LGDKYEEDVSAFSPEFPDTLDYTANAGGMWEFQFTGGGQPIDFDSNMNDPGSNSCWNEKEMQATFTGDFTTREEALRIAGAIIDALPMPEYAVNKVRRFRILDNPTWQRGIRKRRQDKSLGGEQQVWRVTSTFLVLFEKVD
jgi:hypothetical protein